MKTLRKLSLPIVCFVLNTLCVLLCGCDRDQDEHIDDFSEIDFVDKNDVLEMNQISEVTLELDLPSNFSNDMFLDLKVEIVPAESIVETELRTAWKVQLIAPKYDSQDKMIKNASVRITPATGADLTDKQRQATLKVKYKNGVIQKNVETSSVPTAICLNESVHDWSNILLMKQGSMFFYKDQDGESPANVVFFSKESPTYSYVELNEDGMPSKIVIEDCIILISNYRNNKFDVATINQSNEINVFKGIEYVETNARNPLFTRYGNLPDKVISAVSAIGTVATILSTSAVILATFSVGITAASVIAGIACIAFAAVLAYSAIVDIYNSWVAPAPEDMLHYAGIIGFFSMREGFDVALFALGKINSFLVDKIGIIDRAIELISGQVEIAPLNRWMTPSERMYKFDENPCPAGYKKASIADYKELFSHINMWDHLTLRAVFTANPYAATGYLFGPSMEAIKNAKELIYFELDRDPNGCYFLSNGGYVPKGEGPIQDNWCGYYWTSDHVVDEYGNNSTTEGYCLYFSSGEQKLIPLNKKSWCKVRCVK